MKILIATEGSEHSLAAGKNPPKIQPIGGCLMPGPQAGGRERGNHNEQQYKQGIVKHNLTSYLNYKPKTHHLQRSSNLLFSVTRAARLPSVS
jgi:hypothetical protein